jgi:hypothetical protein
VEALGYLRDSRFKVFYVSMVRSCKVYKNKNKNKASGFQGDKVLRFLVFDVSRFQVFEISWNQVFRFSRYLGLRLRSFRVLKFL